MRRRFSTPTKLRERRSHSLGSHFGHLLRAKLTQLRSGYPPRLGRGPAAVVNPWRSGPVDLDAVERPHAMPVDRISLRPERCRVAMAGHAEERHEPPALAGLLDELTDQCRTGLLAIVGAAAGQVPAARAGVVGRDPGQQ